MFQNQSILAKIHKICSFGAGFLGRWLTKSKIFDGLRNNCVLNILYTLPALPDRQIFFSLLENSWSQTGACTVGLILEIVLESRSKSSKCSKIMIYQQNKLFSTIPRSSKSHTLVRLSRTISSTNRVPFERSQLELVKLIRKFLVEISRATLHDGTLRNTWLLNWYKLQTDIYKLQTRILQGFSKSLTHLPQKSISCRQSSLPKRHDLRARAFGICFTTSRLQRANTLTAYE